jgi:hypothetical protein
MCEVKEWLSHMRVVVNKALIEVAKVKEFLDFLD